MAILKEFKGTNDPKKTGISSDTWTQMRQELGITDKPKTSPSLQGVQLDPKIIWFTIGTEMFLANTTANFEEAEQMAKQNGCRLLNTDELASVIMPEGYYWVQPTAANDHQLLHFDSNKECEVVPANPYDFLLVPLKLDMLDIPINDWKLLQRHASENKLRPGPEMLILTHPETAHNADWTAEKTGFRIPIYTEIERLVKSDRENEYWVYAMDLEKNIILPFAAKFDPSSGVALRNADTMEEIMVALVRKTR